MKYQTKNNWILDSDFFFPFLPEEIYNIKCLLMKQKKIVGELGVAPPGG